MEENPDLPWVRLTEILGRDPARRGLGVWQAEHGPLCPGGLEAAARDVADCAAHVAIVTGFCVADLAEPVAETDGPPGALYLARALAALGIRVTLISDVYGIPLLRWGKQHWGLEAVEVAEFPFEAAATTDADRLSMEPAHNQVSDAWVEAFYSTRSGRTLTHLLSIERVGPSHTTESLLRQRRTGPAPIPDFEAAVPPASRNVCHNMRGVNINAHTAKVHRLFEYVDERKLPVSTIGIGDGGNEIGMGSIPWETLQRAIATGPGGQIACRIATRHTIVAGVSNWGGYALAAAVCLLRGQGDLLRRWDCESQRTLITQLVCDTKAVDGCLKLCQATVDGLPLETYLQGLASIRRTLGFEA